MAGDERAGAWRQRVEHGEAGGEAPLADSALGPVEPHLRAGGGLERDNREAGQGNAVIYRTLQGAKAAIGIEETLGEVEIGKIVVPDLDGDRHPQSADPCRRSSKLAVPRAHGEIAGDRDRIRPLAGDARGNPIERGGILQPKVHVADVKQADHGFLPRPCRTG